jgi:hypothetical protein
MAISDLRASNVSILALQIRPYPAMLDDPSEILYGGNVIDVWQSSQYSEDKALLPA